MLKEAEHREPNAIRGRSIAHERALTRPKLRRLHAQWPVNGDAVARAAPVALRDDDVDAAWAAEVERRSQEIKQGVVRPIPWATVKAQAKKRVRGRR